MSNSLAQTPLALTHSGSIRGMLPGALPRPATLPGLRAGFFAAGRSPETWGESIAAVSRVPVRDNGEPLIDPRRINGMLSAAPQPARGLLVRELVARRLATAQASLPTGYRLHVLEGYRSLETQHSLFRFACEQLRRRHPGWTADELAEATNAWVAAPHIAAPPPHVTGGAVDVTLIGPAGCLLDMTGPAGCTDLTAPMKSSRIPAAARHNRRILAGALAGAGLTNYAGEWWHWSYGEPGWAVRTGHSAAVYGAVGM